MTKIIRLIYGDAKEFNVSSKKDMKDLIKFLEDISYDVCTWEIRMDDGEILQP